MVIPISYSEIYGVRPTESQLDELISPFKTKPTFLSLAMWDLMFSLFEEDAEKYKYLQWFFINVLVRENQRERVLRASALGSQSPRPLFGRWQLLALMKRVLIETTDEGDKDPRVDDGARRALGDACLMLNDLLFPDEQMARLGSKGGADERERIHDELMTQWIFQNELIRVPDVFTAVARNDEYFDIFERRATEFHFAGEQTLGQRFMGLTGLGIRQYLRLYFAVCVLHKQLQGKRPEAINADPSIINFDTEVCLSNLDFTSEEREIFFRRVVADLPSLVEGVRRDSASNRAWQFDFTTFRDKPLVYNSESKRGFTCLAFPFLAEKLAAGVYHTILGSWPKGDPERDRFQIYWGNVFEQFINDRLREEYSASALSNRLYAGPFFDKKKFISIEVSDSVLDYGDSLVIIEHKGGYLSADEKYGDDPDRLLKGVATRFGLDKAVKQLSRGIGIIFDEDEENRSTFSELGEGHRPVHTFNAQDVARIRKVYPVLVVQDFAMTSGFMNRRLRMQFAEKVGERRIGPDVRVRPLSLLTVENLEDALEHLEEVKLTDVLDEYAGEEHQPLSTFNDIFDKYLKAKGIGRRRYKWSVKRAGELLRSLMPDAFPEE
jgi:hypothetical protein